MHHHLHHVHIFASDVQETIRFYQEIFDGKVVLDTEMAGARNVFIRIGSGRLHLYDQPPKNPGRGSIHHFGIQTDDIAGVVERLKLKGVPLRKEVADLGVWKYVMAPAPDDVLIELFEVRKDKLPVEYQSYFD
ncbi:MAG: VOC family protein [Deltaproteobacteria bacterium]|nr:VOC family protein [Deltaproteobacteria bacterium]